MEADKKRPKNVQNKPNLVDAQGTLKNSETLGVDFCANNLVLGQPILSTRLAFLFIPVLKFDKPNQYAIMYSIVGG